MTKPSPLMLGTILLLQNLAEEEREAMADAMWIENYRRGESFGGPGEAGRETARFVYKGIVSLYTLTRRGGRKILFFQGPGKLLNQDVLSGGGQLTAEAATDAIVLCMEREALADRVRRTPALAEALCLHYERKLWRLGHQLKNSADTWFVERKLAAKLLKLSGDFGRPLEAGVEIPFPLTVQQMADYIGVSRETVSRACKKLTDLGLIQYRQKRFLIPDRAKLETFRKEA